LAPGSQVVTDYLKESGLQPALDRLGFQVVGYGCTTCIGNSGPLPDAMVKGVVDSGLAVAAVLSGNRNFEGRIHANVRANYLASPALVVAYAIAGRTDIDLTQEPLAQDKQGKPVYLKDIWPSSQEIAETIEQAITPEMFTTQYGQATQGPEEWQKITGASGELYHWDDASTYVHEPPYFQEMPETPPPISGITGARCLLSLGDSVTTDHISPAGSIKASSPAGLYLQKEGVAPLDFNSYGARRGDDRVMTRGTFANIRIKNLLVPGVEGGVSKYLPTGETMSVYDAAIRYQVDGTPLVVLAGAEYGTGSSRDWAAKGTYLLGVRAVIATSFERIHRSNLVGMGVLPLQFREGESRESLGLDGTEVFEIAIDDKVKPLQAIEVTAKKANGDAVHFVTTCRIDTPVEVEYYRNGGILHTVLRQLLKS
ncbi:MAG: aconitase family protein, partial [Planctomycetaceae bacterium]|nr:aconitase family protein [Planctomycetaceae bacterium]